MRRVWAITSGSYSDYQVCAILPTEKAAKEALEQARTLAPDWGVYPRPDSVTSFVAYDEGEMPALVTVYRRQVVVWDTGQVDGRPPFGLSASDPEPTDQPRVLDHRVWDWSGDCPKDDRTSVCFVCAPLYDGKGGRLEVSGRNEQAVNQSLSDNLARLVLNAETTGKARL